MKERYEIKLQMMVRQQDLDKEVKILSITMRLTDKGIELERDPRPAQKVIASLGLERAKPVATPGVKATFTEMKEDSGELPGSRNAAFRGAVAQGNYLAADRPDEQLGIKEVCRWMSKPSIHVWKALRRVCRYLVGAPRLVHCFKQQSVDAIYVYVDTDWAGWPQTRKPTSGGCIMFGQQEPLFLQ